MPLVQVIVVGPCVRHRVEAGVGDRGEPRAGAVGGVRATEIHGRDVAGAQHVDRGLVIAARELELAGEVVARSERHDPEHATHVGSDTGEHADGAVTPARDDGAVAPERVVGTGHEVAGVGREHDLDVEVDGGERFEHVGEAGPGPTAPGRRVHDRGPAARAPAASGEQRSCRDVGGRCEMSAWLRGRCRKRMVR